VAGGNLSSPAAKGSFAARQEPDRAAHDQRGHDENGKTGLEPNSPQIPSVTERMAAAYVKLCQNPTRDWRAWVAELDGDAGDVSTASLAAGYVATCKNPLRDTGAWLAVIDDAPPLSAVAKYVQLCQNPLSDWRAWLDDHQPRNTGGHYERLESTEWLCGVALQEMRSGLDAIKGGFGVDRLHLGSPADTAEFDAVQPLRRERGIDSAEIVERKKNAAKGKGRATGGGAAFQLRKARRRDDKRHSFVSRLADGMRRSVVLNAIGRAAAAIGRRQIRVAEYGLRAHFNAFRNWGGAPMREYRRIVSATRRRAFYGRVARNFLRDLNRPHPK